MRIAVLGLGFMGSTHLQALQNIPDAELVAVVSDDPVKLGGDLSAVQGNLDRPGQKIDFSRARKYSNIDDAIRDRDIEAVDLCLPTYLHAPAAIAALEAGKHVLVEKPMALDGQECDRMIDTAREAGKVLMVAQVLRFWNAYIPVAEACRAGSYGPVRSALFRRRCAAPGWGKWLQDPAKSGGGVFDLLIHDVDFCIQCFGKPEAVSATGYDDMPSGIDIIHANLFYPGIGAVVVSGGWHHPKSYPFSMEFTVSFQGGTFEYNSAGGDLTLHGAGGEPQTVGVGDKDGFQAELEYFLECALQRQIPARCPPEESSAAVKIMRLITEARNRNGEKIECRL